MFGKIAFLVKELNHVIDELNVQKNYNITEIESQLAYNNKIIKKLKTESKPIPTELTEEKRKCLEKISAFQKSNENLRLLKDELKQCIRKIRYNERNYPRKAKKKQINKERINLKIPVIPYRKLEEALILSLEESGGSGNKDDIISQIETQLSSTFTEADIECLNSGKKRWIVRLYNVRHQLVKRGIIKKDSVPGIWELKKIKR